MLILRCELFATIIEQLFRMPKTFDNPFFVAGYAGSEYFCDRVEESATLKRYLQSGNNVTLISLRRMGKTGLIHHVFDQIRKEDPDALTVYVDLMPTDSLSSFARAFSVALMERLDTKPAKILKKATMFLSRVRPSLSFDPITGDPKLSVDIAPGEETDTVEHLLDYVGSCGRRCYVAFDEFQQIAQYPEKNVEAVLRSKIQFLQNANFIFSGSNHHMLSEMFVSAKRPFYASTAFEYIGPIASDDYYPFAAHFFQRTGRAFPERVFLDLYNRFEGHTWYIQRVLNKLYAQSSGTLDQISVERAVREILDENAYYYQTLLRSYTKGQGKLLKAIAKEGKVSAVLAGGFVSKYGLNATSSVKGALKRLEEDEQVYKAPDGYIVYDRFMAEWLRKLD